MNAINEAFLSEDAAHLKMMHSRHATHSVSRRNRKY
jgi:hypothetical protein